MSEHKKERCKQEVSANGIYRFHQCSRVAVKDGYCNQHHPDNVKARQDEQMKKWLEKRANDPLRLAQAEITRLKDALELIATSCEIDSLQSAIDCAKEALAKAKELG